MKCCSEKEKDTGKADLVECESCGMKVARDVAAVMYLKGQEHYFCSFECQDIWESKNPGELW